MKLCNKCHKRECDILSTRCKQCKDVGRKSEIKRDNLKKMDRLLAFNFRRTLSSK